MIEVSVQVKIPALKRFAKVVHDGMSGTSLSNPVRKAFNQWGVLYRGFLQRRFTKASRGDGTWLPLKKSTIEARIKRPLARARAANRAAEAKFAAKKNPTGKQVGRHTNAVQKRIARAKAAVAKARTKIAGGALAAAILRDTGTLFRALRPAIGAPGQHQRHIPFGLEVGYGKISAHKKARMTIGDLARIHQTGAGRVPKREIVVRPDERTIGQMARVMERAIKAIEKGEGT